MFFILCSSKLHTASTKNVCIKLLHTNSYIHTLIYIYIHLSMHGFLIHQWLLDAQVSPAAFCPTDHTMPTPQWEAEAWCCPPAPTPSHTAHASWPTRAPQGILSPFPLSTRRQTTKKELSPSKGSCLCAVACPEYTAFSSSPSVSSHCLSVCSSSAQPNREPINLSRSKEIFSSKMSRKQKTSLLLTHPLAQHSSHSWPRGCVRGMGHAEPASPGPWPGKRVREIKNRCFPTAIASVKEKLRQLTQP